MHSHAQHHAALEREGELSAGLAAEAIALAARLCGDDDFVVRRVVDLGCGPGVGTVALAEAFPAATVLAVDESPVMLEWAAARAAEFGCSDRVEICQLDLNGELGSLGACDLAWAGMSIHHAHDEVATLRAVRSLIAPSGLLCVLERADPLGLSFADDLGQPGMWTRLETARGLWFESMRDRLPGAMRAETYPAMLAAAGLDVVIDRAMRANIEVPRNPAMDEFVLGVLRRSLADLASVADEADLEALRRFLDETPSAEWGALSATTTRKLFIARPKVG